MLLKPRGSFCLCVFLRDLVSEGLSPHLEILTRLFDEPNLAVKVGQSSPVAAASQGVSLCWIKVTVKANPVTLFLVCLHLLVCLLLLFLFTSRRAVDLGHDCVGFTSLSHPLVFLSLPFSELLSFALVKKSFSSSSSPPPARRFGFLARVSILQGEEVMCQEVLLSASDLIRCEIEINTRGV